MDGQFLAPLIPIVAIIAFTAVKITRLRMSRPDSLSADVSGRLEALEHDVESLHQGLAETQERLDFAERMLSKAKEERRIGGQADRGLAVRRWRQQLRGRNPNRAPPPRSLALSRGDTVLSYRFTALPPYRRSLPPYRLTA